MKKFLLIAVLAAFGFTAGAQTQFGVTAGYTNNSFDDIDSTSGFSVGAFVDIEVSESFSVQPELAYSGTSKDDLSYNLFNVNAMKFSVYILYGCIRIILK